ncbi:hypothetical protein Godav_002963 [Gossypium davidsonii]|uniref:Aminotransferase-like plant mobile domain-containing protein n=3 Tax=Gossypium TaxID=3633 RepID=A0A7J8SXT2_GOSDV|nr:hypothetical protein [Gossypium davidsonii]
MDDNAAVRTWYEMTQREKCDSLAEGYVSELWDYTRISTFLKKLMNITGMSKQWVTARIKQKRDTLGHVDEAVTDLFDRLDKRVTPVSMILAETFRSLNACQKTEEGRFIGCAQLLLAWQYKSRLFVPVTQGLAGCEFSYKGDGYKKKVREMSNAWNQTRRMKRLAVGSMTTTEYYEWWVKRINDNVLGPNLENSQSIEEHLRVVPSELEIIKIEEMKNRIEELEIALRNCEVRIEYLEANKGRQNEQLHYFKNQVRNRDHVMGEAVVQIREVADHLQTLAVQANTLSVKYELESDRGQKLASLLKRIKDLSIRAKPYL